MLVWLFASPAERRLLGEARLRGPTAWLVAIMTFSIMIIAAAGLALANTAGVLSNAIQTRYSVEVAGGGANLDQLLRAVRSAPGVVSAEAVPEQEMRRGNAPERSVAQEIWPGVRAIMLLPGRSRKRRSRSGVN